VARALRKAWGWARTDAGEAGQLVDDAVYAAGAEGPAAEAEEEGALVVVLGVEEDVAALVDVAGEVGERGRRKGDHPALAALDPAQEEGAEVEVQVDLLDRGGLAAAQAHAVEQLEEGAVAEGEGLALGAEAPAAGVGVEGHGQEPLHPPRGRGGPAGAGAGAGGRSRQCPVAGGPLGGLAPRPGRRSFRATTRPVTGARAR